MQFDGILLILLNSRRAHSSLESLLSKNSLRLDKNYVCLPSIKYDVDDDDDAVVIMMMVMENDRR